MAFRLSPHPIGITELDTGRCLEINDACLEIFGFRRDEVIGRTTLMLGIWPDPEERIRLIERVSGPFTVVDRRKVLLNLANPSDPAEYTTSVVVEDPALAEHLLARFDALWAAAEGAQAGLLARWEREHEAAA